MDQISVGEGRGLLGRPPHPVDEGLKGCPALLANLPAQEIEGLNPVGPFVNRVEPVVPVELFYRVLPAIAVPPEHLDGQAVGLETELTRPRLGDRGEQVELPAGQGPAFLG